MRTLLAILATLAVSSTASNALAQDRIAYVDGTVSLGLGLGDPTALDVKFWTGNGSGFDFGLGLEHFDDVFGIYGEYELGLAAFRLGDSGGRGVFYVGLGGAVAFKDNDETSVALIIPIGLDFRLASPVDIFIEARPGAGLVHRPAFGIGGQLGIRFRI